MKPSLPLFVMSVSVLAYAAATTPNPSAPARPSSKKVVDFDREIQPIISGHCFKCHGPDAAQAAAGLRLDLFAGATKKFYDGAAIVPGSPSTSILLKRVDAKDAAMRMPPPDSGVKPLSKEEIATLSAWIGQGARYENHWSYLPPKEPKLPSVKDLTWCRNPIDRFVLAKLESNRLKPEPEADKDTLAMRAAETLTGLPPTANEREQFEKDTRPGAYERYVDRLLAKPSYGENQARYWLDAVRYGDTHGLQLDNERSVFPYRDWVIKSFNQDLPFDKFTQWQLGGDLLPNPTNDQLVATGYVRMNLTSDEGGAIPEEFLARNTFDRVDTTSTIFLGMTVGCAKCHDHKYDPIKQKDYYGMYAFFDSTQDDPLDGNIALPPPVIRAPSQEQNRQLASIQLQLDRIEDRLDLQKEVAERAKLSPRLSSRNWEKSDVYTSPTFDAAFDQINPPERGEDSRSNWKTIDFKPGQDEPSLVGADHASVYVRGVILSPVAQKKDLYVSSDDGVKVWLNGVLIHTHKVTRGLKDGVDRVPAQFQAGENFLLAKVINGAGPDGLNIHLESDSEREIREATSAYKTNPTNTLTRRKLAGLLLGSNPAVGDAALYQAAINGRSVIDSSVPMTLIARELSNPRPTYVLKRGLYDQKGDLVHRHVPAFLGSMSPKMPLNRLGLAEWFTSPSNPLVSRVFVNRLWQQHFGVGIVKTVDDFGSQGEWPVNQPLLDYLAVRFVKGGWSVKQINRLIVTSAAFRQSAKISVKKLAEDPENRLISRGPRYRLDAEEIRDKALFAGGLLLEKMGGRGFKPYQPDGLWQSASDPASGTHVYVRDKDSSIYRRSLYMFWKRTSPPPVLVTFDAPLRDSCIVRRSSTNTPLQALTLMNETGFLEASRTMAAAILSIHGSDSKRMDAAVERTLGRPIRPVESKILLRALSRYRARYLSDPADAAKLIRIGDAPQAISLPAPEQAAWMLVCSSLMNTDEFITLH
jgi:mono/diheme cytochrome c family protein